MKDLLLLRRRTCRIGVSWRGSASGCIERTKGGLNSKLHAWIAETSFSGLYFTAILENDVCWLIRGKT